MAGQTERLLGRARERFTVQDYYGAIYLLEEIVASGRAFADVHHLIGVSLSLLGRPEEALLEFARALGLNPRYLEALIHQGLGLSELGWVREAEESFRRTTRERPGRGLPRDAGAHRRVKQGVAMRAVVPALLAAALAAGCGAGDHERLGDRAYGQTRYPEALAEYRAVLRGKHRPDVWAKVGAAALHAGELRESAEAYLRLADDDPTRGVEAAEGLESVARAAERVGNTDVLREVVTGLQAMSPDRPTGRYALLLAQQP